MGMGRERGKEIEGEVGAGMGRTFSFALSLLSHGHNAHTASYTLTPTRGAPRIRRGMCDRPANRHTD